MSATTTTSVPPPRRWSQFSLRAIFLLMCLVAAYFAGWTVANRRARELEQQALYQTQLARASEMIARVQAEHALLAANKAEQRASQAVLREAAEQYTPTATSDAGVESPLAAEIAALLRAQAGAWNQGDADRFMQDYWHSDQLTFSSGGQITRGWDATLARYRTRYPTPEKMGQLTFDQLEVFPLGDAAALVLGRWQLVRDPDMLAGNFSLVMRKFDDRWLIVHDHTSQAEKPATPPPD